MNRPAKVRDRRHLSPNPAGHAVAEAAQKRRLVLKSLTCIVLDAVLTLSALWLSGANSAWSPAHRGQEWPTALADLLAMTPRQLGQVDVAAMNLLCTQGLPGAERLDVGRCLATLDEGAGRVKAETDRHRYRVTDPRYADHYRHSESYYRAEMLVQVLQEDCKVRYNAVRVAQPDFRNSKELFLHGMIGLMDVARRTFCPSATTRSPKWSPRRRRHSDSTAAFGNESQFRGLLS